MDSHNRIAEFPLAQHHEIAEIFADHLTGSTFHENTLRLEFAVTRLEDAAGGNAPPHGERHVAARLVLSVPCTVDLLNRLNKVAAQLAKAGIVTLKGGLARSTRELN